MVKAYKPPNFSAQAFEETLKFYVFIYIKPVVLDVIHTSYT